MQIVIDIPDEEYQNYLKMRPAYPAGVFCYIKAIQNGIPLPKGHRRLVDIDLLRDQVSHDEREAFSKHQVWLLLSIYNKKISTIIEADRENEE